MASLDDYEAGWLDTGINKFLNENGELARSRTYTLITSLDSNPDVISVFRFLEGRKSDPFSVPHATIGRGVLVPTRRLIVANRKRRLFFGFDEIWFFPGKNIAPKPADFTITRPGPIDPLELGHHVEWMSVNGCYLGLGDGEGMNYCLRVRGFPKLIVKASNGLMTSVPD